MECHSDSNDDYIYEPKETEEISSDKNFSDVSDH